MENNGESSDHSQSLSKVLQIDQICDRFDHAIHDAIQSQEQWPSIEDYLGDVTEPVRSKLWKELRAVEASYRRQYDTPEGQNTPAEIVAGQVPSTSARPNERPSAAGHSTTASVASDEYITHIGRYRIEKLLGSGGFGRVYRCHDDVLKRSVAIKVPQLHLLDSPELYLKEAQILAGLEHPAIVPVYDAGRSAGGLCYVVSKFIEGSDLAKRIKQTAPTHHEAVELVAIIAEALHYAHSHLVVHRDVKPANILLDCQGRPYLADFGLALKEEDFGRHGEDAGTPAYMSPEQARREGHLVDGRSDIFSLGVVFYELLTAARPFDGSDVVEILERVRSLEPRPPRQLDDTIPKELERICLKALSKRASDRYMTALDMAEDLRAILAGQQTEGQSAPSTRSCTAAASAPAAESKSSSASEGVGTDKPERIVPKGLRSFDAEDADFFLELLPGPHDRQGLPESIRFWKRRIEEIDPDKTFRVGLIYGPSGCGKSSLVKAGLLPRLADHVTAVYVEAVAEGTEGHLLRALRKACPGLPGELGLAESVEALRRGRGVPAGRKLLIVLDQFEQWLHARLPGEDLELVQALRQCDAATVQCVVMVRDDFWLAISRFFQELEVLLLDQQNSALVDLFDPRHARRVLAAFGRAYGALPDQPELLTKEQKGYLDDAVAALSREGKVVCVRLALFAEMMKGREWTPAALHAVGGTEGIGLTFLEETFSASTAPPEHRLHEKAARGVLKALLPEPGMDIKGLMRSQQELAETSGYSRRPKEFEGLIRVLDSELRLITPTDPGGRVGGDDPRSSVTPGQRYYQLTHDYLVHSLREWLTRKQKETRRGRAELMLVDRAVVWNARPENRQLPSVFHWARIHLLTKRKIWTAQQRKMMKAAGRHHLHRGCMLAMVVTLIGWISYEGYGWLRARDLVQNVTTAETSDVSRIINELSGYHRWADKDLRAILGTSDDPKAQLHASLALLPVDSSQVQYLYERLLKAAPSQVPVIVAELADQKAEVAERLWSVLEDANRDGDQRLRAASALAQYAPGDPRWKKVGREVAAKLVTENSLVLGTWIESLRPASQFLREGLADILQDETIGDARKIDACDVYASFSVEGPGWVQELTKRLQALESVSPERRANVAAALLRMNQYGAIRENLRHSPDPTVRSHLIQQFHSLAIDPKMLWRQLQQEKEVSIRRALVLGMGEFDPEQLVPAERAAVIAQLVQWYRDDPDPGIHGATEWTLRKWKQDAENTSVVKGLATGKTEGNRLWYVTRQEQTMVVINPGLAENLGREERRNGSITRSFAIGQKDVTVGQYLRFRHDHQNNNKDGTDCPVDCVSWYDAAAYCNWLSEKEGIPKDQWCYVADSQNDLTKGMKIHPGRKGYRLPSEWEWEYSCRAGSVTQWCFGYSEELLVRYAWYLVNARTRTWPVGTLKPNDLGLFDVHGNLWQWCQNPVENVGPGGGVPGKVFLRLPSASGPQVALYEAVSPADYAKDEKDGPVEEKTFRALRGGSFEHGPWHLRSENRYARPPSFQHITLGFRLARTCN
jgi:eukaryotic-like serine/threonine-protein kinase